MRNAQESERQLECAGQGVQCALVKGAAILRAPELLALEGGLARPLAAASDPSVSNRVGIFIAGNQRTKTPDPANSEMDTKPY